MSHPIKTTNDKTPQGSVSTTKDASQSTSQWARAHITAVHSANPSIVAGAGQLCTEWWCGNPPAAHEPVCTTRDPNEDDDDFQNRHFEAVLDAMLNCPPVA